MRFSSVPGKTMIQMPARHVQRTAVASVFLCFPALFLLGPSASAQPPGRSARVQRAIDRGLAYLEKNTDSRVGGKALIGLCFLKSGRPNAIEHPRVKEAIEAIKGHVRKDVEKINLDIYSAGISLMFLAELDDSRYRFEIEKLVEYLHHKQKEPGAWGYPLTNASHGKTCDTSMTQYAVLGLWEAEELMGVKSPPEVWERVSRWLLLTQDPSGGFGYQGKPAYEIGERVKQSGVRHSLTAAALASLYIAKDRLGFRELKRQEDAELPAAFEAIDGDEKKKKIETDLSKRDFGRVIAAANRWLEEKYQIDKLNSWVYYSLYALERFEAFREADLAGSPVPLPKSEKSKWYLRASRYVLKTQKPDGTWESNAGTVPSTCFAILILTGSTKQSLAKSRVVRYRASMLRGGRGLPQAEKIRVRDGRIVVAPLDAPLPRVLDLVQDPRNADYAAAVEALADAATKGAPATLRQHLPALRTLVRRMQGEVRRLAIEAVGRADDLDSVPLLIKVVESADVETAVAAATALGKISRKYETLGVTRQSTPEARRKAATAWRSWYQGRLHLAQSPN